MRPSTFRVKEFHIIGGKSMNFNLMERYFCFFYLIDNS